MATSNTRAKENERQSGRAQSGGPERNERGRFEGNRGNTGTSGSNLNRSNAQGSSGRTSTQPGMVGKTRRGTEEE